LADVAEMTREARVVMLGRRWPGDIADRSGDLPEPGGGPAGCTAPIGADSGRGLWLAATLADELSITSGPDRTIVSLYMRLD
jgi:hypothetical protein